MEILNQMTRIKDDQDENRTTRSEQHWKQAGHFTSNQNLKRVAKLTQDCRTRCAVRVACDVESCL